MSHFSKIKTNITNLNILLKTLKQLGFSYEFFHNTDNDIQAEGEEKNILVYQFNKDTSIFSCVWNGCEYNLIVDVQLWNLGVDFNYFLDRLFQQYAYNIVLNTSYSSDFQVINEVVCQDGSIQLTFQKWNNN
uniref:Uncharacterized protein ycf35 n=1 Tax=Dipterosiphonia australica TaxID=2007208 RepID=A0A1Z1MKY7_9FLOR|nr:hypothetical protein [Dipterosiphonia australica]ARW66757.1 hypothetical protein [Dipterosiphonia australica]